MRKIIRKGFELKTIINLLNENNIKLLTLDFNSTKDICEYECMICNHIFKTALKFKFSQIKKGKNGCPVCSKKIQIVNYTKKDPITGKSRANINAQKSAITMNKKDPITGISIYEQNGDKIKNTVSKLDDSGISLAKKRGQKTRKTKLLINPITNKTNYQETAEASAKTMAIKFLKELNIKHSINFNIHTTIDEYINIDNGSKILFTCKKCNTQRQTTHRYIRCYTCNPIIMPTWTISKAEKNIFDLCKQFTSNIILNDRIILNGKELDIYLPDFNLAIEYNGVYWHSEIYKDEKYHIAKTNKCLESGIQLIHIWENDWENQIKQEIWKSIIRNKLGKSLRIYARKCEIRLVNTKEKGEFLDINHLQGKCGSSVNIGLYYNNELVSLMTFGKSRFNKKIDWELLRFCNKLNTSIVGGASKLLKEFRKENTGSIISYADLCRSNGNLYKSLNFNKLEDSKPGYWWYKGGIMENRMNFQKKLLPKKLEIYDKDLTEIENMHENGFVRIFNCGNQVWMLE